MPEKRRGYVGPVLLILFGVVMLLSQLNVWTFSWGSLIRLWPVLLILFGLEVILGRSRTGSALMILVTIAAVVLMAVLPPGGRSGGAGYATEVFSHPSRGAEAAEIELKVGAARLDLESLGDSANIIEAEVSYHRAETELDFGGRGVAEISLRSRTQRIGWTPFDDDDRESWQVRLNPAIPMRIKVDSGVGSSDLDLENLALTALDVNAGVGEMTITLPRQGSYDATIDCGVGKLTLYLPEELDARIRVDTGLGELNIPSRFEKDGPYYVTEGYRAADERAEIDIDGGVGSIVIR